MTSTNHNCPFFISNAGAVGNLGILEEREG